jgi:branched-chain amino acid transport system substrate-binding protein
MDRFRTSARKRGRRSILGGALVAAAMVAAPGLVRAQRKAVRLVSLNSLTGAGGVYGAPMRDLVKAVVDEVNAAGGVLGSPVELIVEDDQTNPEGGLRAARKVIDVDKAAAVVGVWSSGVTAAIAPICWGAETPVFTCAGADSITRLPHQGFIFRTQPISRVQVAAALRFVLDDGAKRLAMMFVQTPFAQISVDVGKEMAAARNIAFASVIYEPDKTTYRSELDQVLKTNPDYLFLGGLTPDTIVLLRDLYRASYKGKIMAGAYSVNTKLLEALPPDVTEGITTFDPASALESPAYEHARKLAKNPSLDRFTTQAYDHVNLALLAAALAGDGSGKVIRDHVRKLKAEGGKPVVSAPEGLKLIAAGQAINYMGASGPCSFDGQGDVLHSGYIFNRVRGGKLERLRFVP